MLKNKLHFPLLLFFCRESITAGRMFSHFFRGISAKRGHVLGWEGAFRIESGWLPAIRFSLEKVFLRFGFPFNPPKVKHQNSGSHKGPPCGLQFSQCGRSIPICATSRQARVGLELMDFGAWRGVDCLEIPASTNFPQ